VLAYDAFWRRACLGWRDDLGRSARWLAGENPTSNNDRAYMEQFRNLDKLGLLRLRFMEARLALELYRREHGQWPFELQELVPQYLSVIPADPFSTGPLIYRRQKDDFLLYSVGTDGRDNDGRQGTNVEDMTQKGSDIAWNLDQTSWVRTQKK
jgi:hypothetical protein